MNFVNFVVDFYSHITSHVSQTFASCTHNISYSLLNIVHVIVYVFGLTNQIWKILWVLCKTDLLLKKKEIVCNLNFWENWVLNLGFVKIISSHTHAFFFKIFFNALRRGCIKFCWFSKILFFFYNFYRSSLFFDQSKLRLKISVSLCLFRLIETVFQSIEFCDSGFLKFNVWLIQNTFLKVFF